MHSGNISKKHAKKNLEKGRGLGHITPIYMAAGGGQFEPKMWTFITYDILHRNFQTQLTEIVLLCSVKTCCFVEYNACYVLHVVTAFVTAIRYTAIQRIFTRKPSWRKGKRATAVRVWMPLAKKSTANFQLMVNSTGNRGRLLTVCELRDIFGCRGWKSPFSPTVLWL